jgi:alkylation response protein AidB-like acyl-CoA dehydrogenase
VSGPEFAAVLHEMLESTDVAGPARRWAAGDPAPARAMWRALAGLGVTALAVPEKWGGLGASPLDLVAACEELGHHAVPGPAAGELTATLAAPPWVPLAACAEVAGLVLLAQDGVVGRGSVEATFRSVDETRPLASLAAPTSLAVGVAGAVARALDFGALACSAQLLGAGRALLEASVRHARVRVQSGRPAGAFQAVKHRLADVAIGLEFARPARTALQVHGAIGYTAEHDLSRFLLQVRALVPAWGAQAEHRARVLREL